MTAPEGTSDPARNFIGEGDLPSSSQAARSIVLFVKLTCFLTGAVLGNAGRTQPVASTLGGEMCVPAAIFVGSSENLRLGVRRMDRTR